jgi:hypothetical protein
MIFARVQTKFPFLRAHPRSLTCQAGDPVDSPVTWASAPSDAAAVARDVSDRADGVSGLVDPALPAHAPTGAVAAGDRRSAKRGCAPFLPFLLSCFPDYKIPSIRQAGHALPQMGRCP